MADNLMENWSETKTALTDGLTGTKKQVMETTLENTKSYLAEAATAGATGAGNIATLNKVILPVIRRVMPTVIANEIVGVQPMTGPVGQIHTLRVRYAETFDSATAGDEALSPFAIATGYSGNETTNQAEATSGLEAISSLDF
jgi:ABC-type arginine/histidine transport system permease subunit